MKRNAEGYIEEFEPTKCDVYSLDVTLSTIIYQSLKLFRESTISCPTGMAFEDWKAILQKMENGFEKISNQEHMFLNKELQLELDECLDLFRKYFFNLWL